MFLSTTEINLFSIPSDLRTFATLWELLMCNEATKILKIIRKCHKFSNVALKCCRFFTDPSVYLNL